MVSACVVMFSSMTYAAGMQANDGRYAVQAAIVTGGNFGVGLVHYTSSTEIGATVSGKFNNASNRTALFTPAIFAGFRKPLGERTTFAYGLDLASKFGQDEGQHIDENIQIGPYISLEQALTNNLLLVGWIEPYTFEYEKKAGSSTTTQRLFGAGGLGLSYLF